MNLSNIQNAILNTLKLPFGFYQSIQKSDTVDLKNSSDLEKLKQTITYKGAPIEAYVLDHKTYIWHFIPFLDTPFLIPSATNTQLIETTTFTSNITARQIYYSTATSTNPAGTPLFIGRNIGFFETKEITYIGGFSFSLSIETACDIEGTGVSQTSIFSTTRSGFVNWADLGIISSMGIIPTSDTILQFFQKGFQFNSANHFSTNRISFFINQIANLQGSLGFTDTSLSFTGLSGTINVHNNEPDGLSTGESFIFLDKGLNGSRVDMHNNVLDQGDGAIFFRSDISKTLTTMANADKTIISFEDSIQNSGVDTTCNCVNHQYLLGQSVLIADETAYNGTHIITWVEADSFDINVVHSTSGAGTSKETEFTTSVAHGFLKNETTIESGTTSYNFESEILSLTSTTKYTKAIAFVANDATGSVDSIGLDHTSIYVTSVDNGDASESRSIGSVTVNDNTASTTISTINTYVDLNLNALAVAGSNIEEWEMTNTTTGELKYIGLKPFDGEAEFAISAQSSGSAQEFLFQLVKNGSAMTDGVESATELRSDTNALPLIVPVQAVTDDLFKVQVKNIDGTSNVMIRFMSGEII
jgi:hypothetical protein